MPWSKSCLTWIEETGLPLVSGLWNLMISRHWDGAIKHEYKMTQGGEHVPGKLIIILRGCRGAHDPWAQLGFSGRWTWNAESSLLHPKLHIGTSRRRDWLVFPYFLLGLFSWNAPINLMHIIFSLKVSIVPTHRKPDMGKKGEISFLWGHDTFMCPELRGWTFSCGWQGKLKLTHVSPSLRH
jgi:hypothetical protein